jgi:hypothetical protein
MRTLIAAAITTVALSGVGGAVVASAAAGSDDGDDGFGGPGFGHHGQLPPNGQFAPNDQVPDGQVPNGQVPSLPPSASDDDQDT